MEHFAARRDQTIITKKCNTKNTENQCFLCDKKVDSGPLEIKGKKILVTYPQGKGRLRPGNAGGAVMGLPRSVRL